MAANTTIKVPATLRDRINRDAGERGVTAAELLEKLVDDYERRQRFEAFGRAFAADTDPGYQAEADLWAASETTWPRG